MGNAKVALGTPSKRLDMTLPPVMDQRDIGDRNSLTRVPLSLSLEGDKRASSNELKMKARPTRACRLTVFIPIIFNATKRKITGKNME